MEGQWQVNTASLVVGGHRLAEAAMEHKALGLSERRLTCSARAWDRLSTLSSDGEQRMRVRRRWMRMRMKGWSGSLWLVGWCLLSSEPFFSLIYELHPTVSS